MKPVARLDGALKQLRVARDDVDLDDAELAEKVDGLLDCAETDTVAVKSILKGEA